MSNSCVWKGSSATLINMNSLLFIWRHSYYYEDSVIDMKTLYYYYENIVIKMKTYLFIRSNSNAVIDYPPFLP